MKVFSIIRHATVLAIKDTNCVVNTRAYQTAASPISSYYAVTADVYWRKYPLSRLFCQSHNLTSCWNCKTPTKKINHFTCSYCGKLQDITKEHDFFQLLSVSRNYNLDATQLTKAFRQLQTQVHPDKFSNKSEREQQNSAEWSALINRAYKTLSNPMLRGQYILKLQGEDMPGDNSALNKEFLMEMMERNEEVDKADSAQDLEQLKEQIQKEINEEIVHLARLFSSNYLSAAKEKLVKMKYLLSIQSSIKTKLEKLMNR